MAECEHLQDWPYWEAGQVQAAGAPRPEQVRHGQTELQLQPCGQMPYSLTDMPCQLAPEMGGSRAPRVVGLALVPWEDGSDVSPKGLADFSLWPPE